MNTLFILFLVALVAINLGFMFLKKKMDTDTKTTSSLEELVHRYSAIHSVPETMLLDLANRAISKSTPSQQYENIVRECVRALKQRLEQEERNSLEELLARYAVLEYVPVDELASFVRKAVSPRTPASQLEKIVALAAKNLRQKKALELAAELKAKKEESKNLD